MSKSRRSKIEDALADRGYMARRIDYDPVDGWVISVIPVRNVIVGYNINQVLDEVNKLPCLYWHSNNKTQRKMVKAAWKSAKSAAIKAALTS